MLPRELSPAPPLFLLLWNENDLSIPAGLTKNPSPLDHVWAYLHGCIVSKLRVFAKEMNIPGKPRKIEFILAIFVVFLEKDDATNSSTIYGTFPDF